RLRGESAFPRRRDQRVPGNRHLQRFDRCLVADIAAYHDYQWWRRDTVWPYARYDNLWHRSAIWLAGNSYPEFNIGASCADLATKHNKPRCGDAQRNGTY